MLLTVRTPSKVLFEGDVSDVTIPTRIGQITVLPHHMPLATIVESGIVQFTPDDQSLAHDQTFVFDKKKISMAIGGGIAYIDGQNLIILGTAGSKWSTNTLEELQTKRQHIQSTIAKHKEEWSLQSVEQALMEMELIDAEIKLSKLKN